MTGRLWLVASAGMVLVLSLAGNAWANSLSPYVWFWPGIITVGLGYAFPASLLAAFLERPFVTLAGIRQHSLVVSLRANFLSTLVGILLTPIGYPALYVIGPLWCLVAFAISCVIETCYLRRFRAELRVGWIVAGNAVSSGFLMAIPPIAFELGTHHYSLVLFLKPHQIWLEGTTSLASLVFFVMSFVFFKELGKGETTDRSTLRQNNSQDSLPTETDS